MNRIFRTVVLLLPFLAATFLVGCDTAESTGESTTVTVMTRNLYLGGDLFVLLQAQDASQVPALVQQLYFGSVVLSDIPGRMDAIAAEIEATSPDLVGLQEVTKYSTQTPSDYVTGTTTPNATNVTFDFLQLLMDALSARGLNYTVAATNTNADVELPATADGVSFMDIRLTDRDVILVKEGTTLTNVVEATFQVAAPVPIGGTEIEFTRGYSYGTAMKDGVSFTFANTHLEVGGQAAAAQFLQANALVGALSTATTPVVLVGDFNSDPETAGADGDSYRLLNTLYTDAWSAINGSAAGPTCCHDADLRNTSANLDSRIDIVFFRGDAEAVSVDVLGDEPADITGTGVWPSDHAGVVSTLVVRN